MGLLYCRRAIAIAWWQLCFNHCSTLTIQPNGRYPTYPRGLFGPCQDYGKPLVSLLRIHSFSTNWTSILLVDNVHTRHACLFICQASGHSMEQWNRVPQSQGWHEYAWAKQCFCSSTTKGNGPLDSDKESGFSSSLTDSMNYGTWLCIIQTNYTGHLTIEVDTLTMWMAIMVTSNHKCTDRVQAFH